MVYSLQQLLMTIDYRLMTNLLVTLGQIDLLDFGPYFLRVS